MVVKDVEAHFKKALDPKRLQKATGGSSERDELTATAQGLVLTTSNQTAEWMCRVAQEPENFELVHTYMIKVLLDPISPLGELCAGFGSFLTSRYRNASKKRDLDEAAQCITLGAKRVHRLALTMLPVLSMPTPMLSAMESIRDKIFEHAGGCLMDVCRRVHKEQDKLCEKRLAMLARIVPSELGISRKLWLDEEQPFPYAPVVQHLQAVPCFPSPLQKLERFQDAAVEVAPCVTRYHQRNGAASGVPTREAKLGGPFAGLRSRSMTRDDLRSLNNSSTSREPLPAVASLHASLADGLALGGLRSRSKTLSNLCSLNSSAEPLPRLHAFSPLASPLSSGLALPQPGQAAAAAAAAETSGRVSLVEAAATAAQELEEQKQRELQELARREDLAVGTEDLLPLMAYALVRAAIPRVVSELRYIEVFIGDQPTVMLGALGFCLATFQSAIQVVHILGEQQGAPDGMLPAPSLSPMSSSRSESVASRAESHRGATDAPGSRDDPDATPRTSGSEPSSAVSLESRHSNGSESPMPALGRVAKADVKKQPSVADEPRKEKKGGTVLAYDGFEADFSTVYSGSIYPVPESAEFAALQYQAGERADLTRLVGLSPERLPVAGAGAGAGGSLERARADSPVLEHGSAWERYLCDDGGGAAGADDETGSVPTAFGLPVPPGAQGGGGGGGANGGAASGDGRERAGSGERALEQLSQRSLQRAATVPVPVQAEAVGGRPAAPKRGQTTGGAVVVGRADLRGSPNPFGWINELANKLEGIGKKFLEEQDGEPSSEGSVGHTPTIAAALGGIELGLAPAGAIMRSQLPR